MYSDDAAEAYLEFFFLGRWGAAMALQSNIINEEFSNSNPKLKTLKLEKNYKILNLLETQLIRISCF